MALIPKNWKIHQSVSQFSCSVVSDSLRPHVLQHARPRCPTPGVYSNSCPLSPWCHLTISSSVVPFFSCVQSFPASWSFPMSHINIQMHSFFFLIGWNYSSGCKVLLGNTWLNLSCCCLHWLGPPVCCVAKSSLSYCQWHRLFTQLFYEPEPCQFYNVSTTGIPSFSLPPLWLSTA